MTDTTTISDAAAKADAGDPEMGAAWLEEVQPGWRSKVDPDILDMESALHDVLGQVYETWYDVKIHQDAGFEAMDHEFGEWAVQHGFLLPEGLEGDEYVERLTRLTNQWIQIIKGS